MAGSRFCCSDHRLRYRAHSARALRDVEDLSDDDEWSSNAVWRSTRLSNSEKKSRGTDPLPAVLGLVGALCLIVALTSSGESGGGPPVRMPVNYTVPTLNPVSTPGVMSRLFGSGSAALRDDFHSGLSNWAAGSGRRGWTTVDGYVKPGALRLWKQSTTMSNYQFEFVGQIQRRGIGWAFRAPDTRNFYATKLIISGPASQPNTGLVRFVVLGGQERERVELPLPMSLSRGTDYRISMSIRGNRFLTSVDGQVVSSWTDSRIDRGGVGFFAEDGDIAAVKWASLSERDGVLGRLASYFSLLAFPAQVPAP